MKMKSPLRKIIFITLPSIFIFLIVIEICLRIGGYLYTRYRNPESYLKTTLLNSGTFNILCLGDSFTEGCGASCEKNSYPRQLERLLRENISKDINVINGGCGGNTSSLLLKSLQKDIHKYHPKVIIILIGCNNSWNLKDSSYFLLNRNNLTFQERLDRLLSGLRIYKLVKIGYANFKHKIDMNNKRLAHNRIIPKSTELSSEGLNLFSRGKLDLAMGKMQQALLVDKNNYEAHLGLAQIWNAHKKFQLAKEETWQAIETIEEWNVDLLYTISNRLIQFDDTMVSRISELIKLQKYLQNKYTGGKRKRWVKTMDETIDAFRNEKVLSEVLEYDLKKILSLIKENGARVVLHTYPNPLQEPDNSIIRKLSRTYDIPLVDNEIVFEKKARQGEIQDFFVPDGHCNDRGYRIIAENTYNILMSYIFMRNSKREIN